MTACNGLDSGWFLADIDILMFFDLIWGAV